MRSMAGSKVIKDGTSQSFVLPATTLYKANPVKAGFDFTSPVIVVNLFFLIVGGLTFIEYRRKKRMIWLDFLIFLSLGLAGLLLTFLCFYSTLEATGSNLNLIWALPSHLIFAILWLFPSLRPKLNWYLKFTAGTVILFLMSMPFLPQTFHWLIIPICLVILLRLADKLIIAIKKKQML